MSHFIIEKTATLIWLSIFLKNIPKERYGPTKSILIQKQERRKDINQQKKLQNQT